MLKKILLFLIIFIFFGLSLVAAQETGNLSETELQKKIAEYEQKLTEIRQEKNTLSSQIQYMDTQIYLTQLKINSTEKKIIQTQNEIKTLGERITGLDSSLNYLTKLLLEKIVESYKKRSISFFDFIFNIDKANNLLTGLKYLKTTQSKNENLLIHLQQTKLNFEEQKQLREEKKAELNQLTQTLTIQQKSLNIQKAQKQKLLADTQNNEVTYQKLLQQARAQLAGFKSFVSFTGVGIISANQFGNGSDGNYYSQRDARWANQTIGYSSENILNVGCLLTSVAMVGKKYGADVNPSTIASDVNRFWASTAYMKLPWPGVAGRSYSSIGTDNTSITNELNNGNYVIVGVGRCSYGGSHFVVLTKKDGDDYIMHDPIYGPDLKFSSHYSNICSAATFK